MRRLDTPYVESGDTLGDFLLEMRSRWPRIDKRMAYAPMELDAIIESLLPAVTKNPSIRQVIWANPDVSHGNEWASVFKEAPGDSAKTVFTAVAPYTSFSRNPLVISFPTISDDNPWPEITTTHNIEGSRSEQRLQTYMEVAPALGFLVRLLTVQADDILVLGQEMRRLMES